MRYAILHHDHPFPHWDLLIEAGAVCRTWRLLDDPAGPGPWRAEPIADHRLHYLDYEGPVSGNRGHVTRWDRGTWIWLTATESLTSGLISGQHWTGRVSIATDSTGVEVRCLTIP